ncbi:hypothetical protein EVAR_86162_1 [Eumeta japonica]|uniref:Uncharacterized protein n=1 Tax=Eumeta variegata TaxID=151549 RepID=A0A4C1YYB4_EUMVA|nr:hypothetical protein EVAR_86162_1 [Eumeta japonica]
MFLRFVMSAYDLHLDWILVCYSLYGVAGALIGVGRAIASRHESGPNGNKCCLFLFILSRFVGGIRIKVPLQRGAALVAKNPGCPGVIMLQSRNALKGFYACPPSDGILKVLW